jgi:hypothetical protein
VISDEDTLYLFSSRFVRELFFLVARSIRINHPEIGPRAFPAQAGLACYLQALCSYLLAGGEPPPREMTTWSITTSASRPAASASTARWYIRSAALEQLRRDSHLGSDAALARFGEDQAAWA